jgi:hypothetical protein
MDGTISLHTRTIPHNSQQFSESPVPKKQQPNQPKTKTQEIVTRQNVQHNTKIGFSQLS